ncbi:serine/threonine protein kinase [Povalibacter uvarum]|uniref:Serine/threonine protein kinase n=1 Tax=Povalibacter uvarum TaxID=732238 RepID=A0A841HW81_9GAMM|nr:serine/threonine-protein kinase [Povalibacter uvarum]MBB6096045.1 serine/threonine protein kinase [Povalibacter uvarum]
MSESITVPGYRIERKLGQGGMAAVYLAIQQSFEREVALKIMSPLLNSDPSFTTRFMREARIVAHMHHASIVPVFDVGEHKPYHYLSMEYLPGGDLKQRILQGLGSPQLVSDVCMALCPALDLAHRKGFVHRDIKPENILFREDGTPVLTDFGIARAVDSGTSLTMAGMLVGTPSYMSPEQVKGQELDGRSDLYSLGIVCYEILTGTVPFRADSTLSVALKHLSEPLPTLPANLAMYQAFLNKLTAKERGERFASGSEILKALRHLESHYRTADVTLLRPLPEELRSAPLLRTLPAKAKASVITLSTQLKDLWTRVPPLPKIPWSKITPSKPAIDKRTAMGIGSGVAALLLVAILIRVQSNESPEEQVARAPALVAATPAAATASPSLREQTADSSIAPAPVATAEPEAIAEELDPVAEAARIAQLAEARAQRQAERQRQLEQQRRREAEQQAAAQAAKQEQIEKLLASAQTLYAQGSLALPSGASAADRYQEVLQLQPGQPEAMAGKQRIANVLAQEAEHARSVRDADALRRLIPQIAWVQPGHPKLVELQSQLAALEASPTELTRRQAANLEKAARHVAKAYELIERKPYDIRAADAATDEYDRAASAVAMAPGLPLLKERLISSYPQAVRTELNDNDTRNALKMINLARKRKWLSPELEQMEASIQRGSVAAD